MPPKTSVIFTLALFYWKPFSQRLLSVSIKVAPPRNRMNMAHLFHFGVPQTNRDPCRPGEMHCAK